MTSNSLFLILKEALRPSLKAKPDSDGQVICMSDLNALSALIIWSIRISNFGFITNQVHGEPMRYISVLCSHFFLQFSHLVTTIFHNVVNRFRRVLLRFCSWLWCHVVILYNRYEKSWKCFTLSCCNLVLFFCSSLFSFFKEDIKLQRYLKSLGRFWRSWS